MSDLGLSLSIPHLFAFGTFPRVWHDVLLPRNLEKEKYHVSFDCLISDRSGKWTDRFLLGTSPILDCSRGNSHCTSCSRSFGLFLTKLGCG